MDTLTVNGSLSSRSPTDNCQRVKLLCSFSGSIMPRPRDGKLRYVGGETRIMSVPCDITYKELMEKMREIFEGATLIKYQQPDEELDALVSVVNDDDVSIMMEEYDRFGSGDGLTRLRIFLFGFSDQDISVNFGDGDERDNERRYMDALNNLNESPDFRRQQADSLLVGSPDDASASDQYLNQFSAENSPNYHRHMELSMAQMNLSNLTIPRRGSGQLHQAVSQKYSEMEAPWSPAYYSPRHSGAVDQRLVSEVHASPSSTHYHMLYGDYAPHGSDTGSISYEKNSICENCQLRFHRNVIPNSYQRPVEQPNLEQSVGNGYIHVPNPCVECPPSHEVVILNSDANNSDIRSVFPDAHPGWASPHQHNPLFEEPRPHLSVTSRLMDGYVVDNGVHIPIGHENEQPLASRAQVNRLAGEEHGVWYGNVPYPHGAENMYQIPHAPVPPQALQRNIGLMHGAPAYEASIPCQLVNRPVPVQFIGGTADSSALTSLENLNTRVESSERVIGFGWPSMPDHSNAHAVKIVPITCGLENPLQPMQSGVFVVQPESSNVPLTTVNHLPLVDGMLQTVPASNVDSQEVLELSKANKVDGSVLCKVSTEENVQEGTNNSTISDTNNNSDSPGVTAVSTIGQAIDALQGQPEKQLEFLPELIASAKEAALKSLKDIQAKVQENIESSNEHKHDFKEDARIEGPDGHGDLEADSDNETTNTTKIELTKAEAEAINKGLQTIKNEDLEEIRELGTGTYGSVYHGKWKGSDVAIKRIKAICFAGRPNERERLFADFWNEALLLFSLHHPNVVSFYGVVRDGPDGSLATVTEFMVNGSLKQFLRKKDRTIDRRKRVLIAMDAAFGMEYLHGKNVVHFDLKCENLLVNIRDPHRPVCKIGDLGLSKVKQHTLVSGGIRGTLPWMAPELLSGKSNMVTEKIDVYSFGIVMWELLTGEEPYDNMHCAAIIGGIVNDKLRPEIPTWCDPEWKVLMESCWSSDPSERPSFSEISQRLRTMASAMNPK